MRTKVTSENRSLSISGECIKEWPPPSMSQSVQPNDAAFAPAASVTIQVIIIIFFISISFLYILIHKWPAAPCRKPNPFFPRRGLLPCYIEREREREREREQEPCQVTAFSVRLRSFIPMLISCPCFTRPPTLSLSPSLVNPHGSGLPSFLFPYPIGCVWIASEYLAMTRWGVANDCQISDLRTRRYEVRSLTGACGGQVSRTDRRSMLR